MRQDSGLRGLPGDGGGFGTVATVTVSRIALVISKVVPKIWVRTNSTMTGDAGVVLRGAAGESWRYGATTKCGRAVKLSIKTVR